MIPNIITVYATHGELRVDTKTGKVIAIKERKPNTLSRIIKFETGDWLRHLAKSQMLQSQFARRGDRVDILDLSFWTSSGEYVKHFRERYAIIADLKNRRRHA